LLDHIVQRAQLPLEQQHTECQAQCATQRQPQQVAQRCLPELADGKQRVADHLDTRRLAPAITDNGIALRRLQSYQPDKPGRHLGNHRHTRALDQNLLAVAGIHTDALEIATVEDRTDHQLHHRRVVDMRTERQAQRSRCILRMCTQLVDLLLAGTFNPQQETAGKVDQQQQADRDEQLLEQ